MVEGLEGVGEAVTGGMAARAVEPHAGELSHGGRTCLNCGSGLLGDYCHRCGQQGHVHRTLGAFGHDIAHSVLHFEGKIWRTLPLLAWRPGELTRRYIAGERARFVSPMALFLFSVFLMFAVFSFIGGPLGNDGDGMLSQANSEVDAERPRLRREISELEARRAAAVTSRQDVAEIDSKLGEAREELGIINLSRGDPVGKDGGEIVIEDNEGSDSWFNEAFRKAKGNPSLLIYKLQNNAYKFSWALIPISVPFLWLLLLHRRRYRAHSAYDHTVFVTYSISFMTLMLVALALLAPLGVSPGWALTAITFIPPIHMYRQLRGAYRLSRPSAAWRALLLAIFATIAATWFFTLLLLIGAAA